MQSELTQTCRAAGIDEFTPVDTFYRMQSDQSAFPAIDYNEQYDYDDMLERAYGGQPCFLLVSG